MNVITESETPLINYERQFLEIAPSIVNSLKALNEYNSVIKALKWTGCVMSPAVCPVIEFTYQMYKQSSQLVRITENYEDMKRIYELIKKDDHTKKDVIECVRITRRVLAYYSKDNKIAHNLLESFNDMIAKNLSHFLFKGKPYIKQFPKLNYQNVLEDPIEISVRQFIDLNIIISSRKIGYLSYLLGNNQTKYLEKNYVSNSSNNNKNRHLLTVAIDPLAFLTPSESESVSWDFNLYETNIDRLEYDIEQLLVG